MSSTAKDTRSTTIPCLRYSDATSAIEWLCRAFGFTKHLVVADEKGVIQHAQLTFGNGMIMIGSKGEGEYDKLIKQPSEIGGVETQTPYIVVDNPDDHYEQARAAGADVVMPISDQDYGGRLYVCRDIEGHVWCFGSYDPWAETPATP
jgi:uncharacterized glyoxalase superfamily protein PhnB